jgi:Kef-type K+ transport system membrane component KefB
MVTGVLYLLGLPLPFALLMGAISSATAPAATVAIVNSLKAKGKFIDYLYGIVALDDAGAVILYGILFAVATVIMDTTGTSGLTALINILKAFFSIIASVFLGLASGWLLYQFVKKLYSKKEILIISLGIIIVTTGIATIMGYSPLLANMASGTLLINITSRNKRIFDALKSLSPPIYTLFFIVAGTELKPSVISQSSVIFLGIAYVLARITGKYAGVYTIGKTMGLNKKIYKNLGFCLMPQAGVALGLIMLLKTSPLASHLSHANQLILTNMINIVLFSTFINEILGPFASKQGILRGTNLISNKEIKKTTRVHP